ncbi:hypothetical protein QCA50_003291 [Cerrena zonata]|uniref:Uncharacterized protein n=1 Tax=Cerrena zonata TaxID=2478898 RepID=A0AAW0GPG4_9APHY
MNGFTIAEGRLWGALFGGILYGLYVACFVTCIHLFCGHRIRQSPQNKVILGIIILLFGLTTAHFACTLQQLRLGFFGSSLPNNPNIYFNNRNTPLNLVIKSINGVTMLLGDCLMLFRLWIIYDGSLLVTAIPALSTAATGGVVFALTWEFSQLSPTQTSFAASIKKLVPAAFVLPVVTNAVITSLILYRIIAARAAVRRLTVLQDDNFYRIVIANIVESCLIYPIMLIIAMVLYLCKSNGQDVISGSLPQVVGIVSTLLWILVHRGSSRYDMANEHRATSSSHTARMMFVVPKKRNSSVLRDEFTHQSDV